MKSLPLSVIAGGVLFGSALFGSALYGSLAAQGVILGSGPAVGDSYGKAVAYVGDIDGDGIDDIAIGVEDEDNPSVSPPTDVGAVYVLSGATGAQLYRWTGDFVGDFFGCDVDGAGDVNGDGVPDVIVGGRGEDDFVTPLLDTGAAFVYSGADGSLLYRFDIDAATGKTNESRFGSRVAGVGDCNADGYADVAVGGYTASVGGLAASGVVVVYSGRDGSVLHTFASDQPNSFAGFRVAGAGDVDRDGFDDVLVSAVGYPFGGIPLTGRVRVHSGRDGSVLHEKGLGQGGVLFGAEVAGIGDIDLDGHDDFAIGSVFDVSGAGSLRIYSGATGTELALYSGFSVPQELYGFDVSGVGDWDGDGRPEVAVGAILSGIGAPFGGGVRIYSLSSATPIAEFGGTQPGAGFGFSIDFGGDLNGDGFEDLIVGSPFEDFGGVSDSGVVRAYLSPAPAAATPRAKNRIFGVACATGDSTLPTLHVRGRLALGVAPGAELVLRGAAPGAFWTLNLAAPLQVPLPLDAIGMIGCTVYTEIDGIIVMGQTDAVTGISRFRLPAVPNDPSLLAQSLFAQYVVQDTAVTPSNPVGYVTSNAAQMTLGR